MQTRSSSNEPSRKPLHFVGVGPQRTATTWLYEMLRRHPSIAFPRGVKETKFFDERFDNGFRWYERHFAETDPTQIRGEIAPTYLDDDAARERLRTAFPDLRVIVNLRNPVDRAFSLYRLEVMKGRVSGGFKQAAARKSRIITSGHYAHHCPRWEAAFGRDRVLYVMHEDISSNPGAVLDRICDFLHVPRVSLPAVDETFSATGVPRHPSLARLLSATAEFLRSHRNHWLVNLGKKMGLRNLYTGGVRSEELTAAVRADLLRVFEPDIQWVEQRLGRALPEWRTPGNQD
jgi:hypothetical protein